MSLRPSLLVDPVRYPIRRLIMTGQDTDVNFAKLLGPQWEQCRGTIDKTRIKVLLDPEPGSVAHRRSKRFDRGCPGRTPRIPTQEEEAILRAANDLKAQTLDSLRKKGNRDKRNQDFRDFILGNQEFLTHSSWAFDAAMDGVKGFKRNKKTDFWEKFRRGWAQLWSEKT